MSAATISTTTSTTYHLTPEQMGIPGTVYLLHFHHAIGNERHSAQHYIGWAENLGARLRCHQKGKGAKITAFVASQEGNGWVLAREWDGTRYLERRLKNRKGARALCPVCSGEAAYSRASVE